MYKNNLDYYCFEPVYREIFALSDKFDEIIWMGCKTNVYQNSLIKPNVSKLKIIQLPSVTRYNGILNKLINIGNYFSYFYNIIKYASKATHIHTRGPSHPALIGIIYSLFDYSPNLDTLN